ncbi:Activator of Hsp90 ATPase homolog 1-like protein [Devosia sp. YR412]|uniref:SRPBCC domain-containing protein n=1 Tax=Devosia sp. YR412 TaxID=1881030 RepID=UPI0008AC999B|nr:SRPBCC domain-containing protein [Devosia sp. YR412]SEP97706.1 Activator of Hsp90 ATPase homolog 1-like protein [Devosia sp. YR412]
MSDAEELVFECALDAPVEQVWRALTIPEYLKRWLKPEQDVDMAVVTAEENVSLTYRWREAGQGAVLGAEDSLVTFELSATDDGGTWFRLTHAPMVVPVAANSNLVGPLMLAA